MQEIDWHFIPLFLLGFLGTGHCIGMCGPLVLAFPGSSGRMAAHLWYHGGRILTYTVIGAAMGGVGGGLLALGRMGGSPLNWIAGIQVALSGVAALGLLLFGLVRIGMMAEPAWMAVAQPDRIPGFGRVVRRTMGASGGGTWFILGLFLGALPCGLSFAAFSRALASGSWIAGAGMTLAFGLGTLPGLLLLGSGFGRIFRAHRGVSDLISGMIMIGMALSLVMRIWSGGTAAGF